MTKYLKLQLNYFLLYLRCFFYYGLEHIKKVNKITIGK